MCDNCNPNSLLRIVDTPEFRGYECIGCSSRYHLGYFDNPIQQLNSSVEMQELLTCPRGGCDH